MPDELARVALSNYGGIRDKRLIVATLHCATTVALIDTDAARMKRCVARLIVYIDQVTHRVVNLLIVRSSYSIE